MDFSKAFAKISNSVTVEHPSGMKFDLLPMGHQDAFRAMGLKMNLAKLDKFETYVRATVTADVGQGKQPKLADFFETGEELHDAMASFYAAHITGWSNLEQDGKPLPYSYETARDLLNAYPAFGDWLQVECKRLSDEKAASEEVKEDIKKN